MLPFPGQQCAPTANANQSITAKSLANARHPAHKTDVAGGKQGSTCCQSWLSSAGHPTTTATPLMISEAER